MERVDHKKAVKYSTEDGYSFSSEVIGTDFTELVGSPREADLIVRGLQALRAKIIADEASGVTSVYHLMGQGRAPTWRSIDAPKLEEVETLLKEINEPNYPVSEAITHEHL